MLNLQLVVSWRDRRPELLLKGAVRLEIKLAKLLRKKYLLYLRATWLLTWTGWRKSQHLMFQHRIDEKWQDLLGKATTRRCSDFKLILMAKLFVSLLALALAETQVQGDPWLDAIPVPALRTRLFKLKLFHGDLSQYFATVA